MQTEDPAQDSSLSSINAELLFDWTKAESVSAAVIDAVAEVTEEEPTEMPALYTVVDPDALNQLVESPETGSVPNDLTITFPFDGVRVRLSDSGNGVIRTEPAR